MFLVICKMQMLPSHKLKAIPTFYQGKGRGSWGQSEQEQSTAAPLTLFQPSLPSISSVLLAEHPATISLPCEINESQQKTL